MTSRHQVRLQLIIEKAAQVSLYNGEIGSAESPRAPPAFYLKALRSQLQEVKNKILAELLSNEVELLHFHSTALTINEIGFAKAVAISSYLDLQRLEGLYASLNAIKSWFDVFFAIPPAAYIGFPFSVFS
ncbi:hypothetical protein MMC18_001293 [Xylographa bjoerkii]|nr:hypothetical protein [Xylographa bjoerkii]